MTRFLIFLFPALIDTVLGLVFFVASVRMAEGGGGPIAVTAVTAAWALAYMVSAYWAGRITRAENSARLIMAGCMLLAASSLAFIVVPDLWATYPIIMFLALGTAFFFTPFQVFMKAVDKGDGGALPRSVGLYTFSWSAGMATGPFVSAFIWNRLGWQPCYALGIVLCVATALGVFLLKHHAEEHPEVPQKHRKAESRAAIDYSTMPDLAWLGWICSGIGCLAVAILRSYLPSSATATGIPRAEQGMLLALISGSQALTGLALCRSRLWMYKPLPVFLFGICGVFALFGFASSHGFLPLALSAVLFGISSGAFFFYLVFHSLVHPERSTRYVAINESVVGFTSMLGPLLAGFLAAGIALSAPYWISALLLLASVAFQVWATRHSMRGKSPTTGKAL